MTDNNRTINSADVLARTKNLAKGNEQYDEMCAQFTQLAVLGRDAMYADAKQWQDISRQRGALNTTKQAPAGVPVFFNTSNPHKHVAVSAGGGYVYSTGIGGKIKKVPQSYFGNTYAGWTSAIGGRNGAKLQYINYKKTGTPAKVSKGSSSAFTSGALGKTNTPAVKTFVDKSMGTASSYIPGVK